MRIQESTAIKIALTLREISRIVTLVIGRVLNIKYTKVATDTNNVTITIPVLYFLMYTLDLVLVFSVAGVLLSRSTHFNIQELIIAIAAMIIVIQVGMILLLLVKRKTDGRLARKPGLYH
jgi:hypothetical protein